MSVVRKLLISAALVLSAAFVASSPALAAEPTVDQVYQAAQSGRYIEAQAMLDEVLKAHPNSAKAHYIQAQVYAKQGMMNKASGELANADALDPAGKYASPQAVKALRELIALRQQNNAAAAERALPAPQPNANTAPVVQQRAAPPAPVQRERSFPWGMLLIGVGVVFFIVWVTRMMNRRAQDMTQQPAQQGGMFSNYNNNPGGDMQSYPGGAYGPGGGYGPGYGPAPAPGMGSRIMGGLATGAAVGAGIVAAEAIARHYTHDDSRNANASTGGGFDNGNNSFGPPQGSNYDMGGNDFGVSDSSSWDSGGGGGGDSGGSWD